MMTVSSSFNVLAVELDTGTLFLSDRGGSLGRDELTPAVLSFGQASVGGASLTVEAQALPDHVWERDSSRDGFSWRDGDRIAS